MGKRCWDWSMSSASSVVLPVAAAAAAAAGYNHHHAYAHHSPVVHHPSVHHHHHHHPSVHHPHSSPATPAASYWFYSASAVAAPQHGSSVLTSPTPSPSSFKNSLTGRLASWCAPYVLLSAWMLDAARCDHTVRRVCCSMSAYPCLHLQSCCKKKLIASSVSVEIL